MNYNIILSNARSLTNAYQSDPSHKSSLALKAKDQLKQLTVAERKLLVKIIKSTHDKNVVAPSDDDPDVIQLAKRIVAVQNPNYLSNRTKGKIASFSRSLKNRWNRTSTEQVFKEAKKLPTTLQKEFSAPPRPDHPSPPLMPDDLPPPCPPDHPSPPLMPDDLPPPCPPDYPPPPLDLPPLFSIEEEENQKDIAESLLVINSFPIFKSTNPFINDDYNKKELLVFVKKFINVYQPNKNDEKAIEIAKNFNSVIKKYYPNKAECYKDIRQKYKDNSAAINFLEKHWQ